MGFARLIWPPNQTTFRRLFGDFDRQVGKSDFLGKANIDYPVLYSRSRPRPPAARSWGDGGESCGRFVGGQTRTQQI